MNRKTTFERLCVFISAKKKKTFMNSEFNSILEKKSFLRISYEMMTFFTTVSLIVLDTYRSSKGIEIQFEYIRQYRNGFIFQVEKHKTLKIINGENVCEFHDFPEFMKIIFFPQQKSVLYFCDNLFV